MQHSGNQVSEARGLALDTILESLECHGPKLTKTFEWISLPRQSRLILQFPCACGKPYTNFCVVCTPQEGQEHTWKLDHVAMDKMVCLNRDFW